MRNVDANHVSIMKNAMITQIRIDEYGDLSVQCIIHHDIFLRGASGHGRLTACLEIRVLANCWKNRNILHIQWEIRMTKTVYWIYQSMCANIVANHLHYCYWDQSPMRLAATFQANFLNYSN